MSLELSMCSDPLLPPLTPIEPAERPVTLLLRTLRHIARTKSAGPSSPAEKRLALYLAAVAILAETCKDPEEVTARMARTPPHSSTLVKEASADQLRRTTLALYGLACDRLGLREHPPRYPRNLSV